MKLPALLPIRVSMNRRYPRTYLRTEIWLGQDGIFTRTPEVLRDLSERGAFIQTRQRFSKGSIVSMRFSLPISDRPIYATVVVRHVRNTLGVGVEFLDLSPEDHEELRDFVEGQVARVA